MTGGNANPVNYNITQPTEITGSITLLTPSAPNAPTVTTGNITTNSVTLNTPSGTLSYLALEYARSAPNGTTVDNSTWQPGLTFTGLNAGTNYRFFARYIADAQRNNMSITSDWLHEVIGHPTVIWARTNATGNAGIISVAVDNNGDVYIVGWQRTGIYNYGDGITLTGTSSSNPVLVKYNSSGITQWAKTGSGTGIVEFNSVTVDNNGDVYIAGWQGGGIIAGVYNYGDGITAEVPAGKRSAILIKYNSSGITQWAKLVQEQTGIEGSEFNSVAVDNNGNVYAVGVQIHDGLLVKFNSFGTVQWVKTVSGEYYNESIFYSVAVDNNGNVYAVGRYRTGIVNFGDGVISTGDVSRLSANY
ncbi:MAG: hypothetical protein FWD47_01200 [Treponema sp.]|nr:hypothetical protein [Treponema sp.]